MPGSRIDWSGIGIASLGALLIAIASYAYTIEYNKARAGAAPCGQAMCRCMKPHCWCGHPPSATGAK
jgi:hypothetical protein